MRYATARASAEARLTAYRIYVSDALLLIGKNTANYSGGTSLRQRYVDIIGGAKRDDRTGEEIAADIIRRAGLEVKA